MRFMNNDLASYISELANNNLYMRLSYDEREKIEGELKGFVSTSTENIEKLLGSNFKGVKLEINDDVEFRICSGMQDNSNYRGYISCSRLFLIGTYQMFYSMDYDGIIAEDQDVEDVKKLLFDMSLMCIFYHEFSHIYKGHIRLYNVWKKEQTIREHYLDIQTLEWDADKYAAMQMADWIIRARKQIFLDDSNDFVMKIACGAIHGMMYWQRHIDEFYDVDNKKHPPIFYREMTMLKCIGDLCGDLGKMMLYVWGYEIEFNKLRGISSDEVKKYFEASVEHSQHVDKIEQNWEIVKYDLEQYAICFKLEM